MVYPGWEVNRLLGRTPPGLGRAWHCPFSPGWSWRCLCPFCAAGWSWRRRLPWRRRRANRRCGAICRVAGAVVLTLPAARPGHGAARSFLSSLWPRFGGRPLFCALTQADRLKTERERTLARELASSLAAARHAGVSLPHAHRRGGPGAGRPARSAARCGGRAGGTDKPCGRLRRARRSLLPLCASLPAGIGRDFRRKRPGLLKQAQAAEAPSAR